MEARSVTQASILDAIQNALMGATGPDDALTSKEIAGHLNWPVQKVQKAVTAAWEAGQLECVMVYRQSPSRVAKVPGYRPKK